MPAIPSASWPMPATMRACAAPPGRCWRKSAWARAMSGTACRPQPWRTAPARAGHGAWPAKPRLLLLDEPMAGMGVEESQAHDRLPAGPEGHAHHAADRARHGGRVPAGRPHHRAGLWPRHRQRARPTRSAPTRKCATPISATGGGLMLRGREARGLLRSQPGAVRHGTAIDAGQVVTLLGRNGMGKTTTVQDDDGPAAGPVAAQVEFDGQAIDRLPAFRIARLGLGPGAGGPADLPQPLTVRENLAATAANRLKRAVESRGPGARLRAVPAAGRAGRADMGNQLSGGEQQMLAIGRALMTNPQAADPRRGDRGPGAADPGRKSGPASAAEGRGPGDPDDRQEPRGPDQAAGRPPPHRREGPCRVESARRRRWPATGTCSTGILASDPAGVADASVRSSPRCSFPRRSL
jgi:hypothetical protein